MTARRPSAPRAPVGAPAVATATSAKPARKPVHKPAAKPATARRAAATRSTAERAAAAPDPHDQDAPRQITVRTIVLFVVVLIAIIVLAPTLRSYVAQQEVHRDLQAQIEIAEARNAELERTVERWQDDAFVQAQARERLGFVMPGETPYRVVDPETVTGVPAETADDAAPGETGPVTVPQTGPWYLTVRDSVQVAGEVSD